ncbi:hypothetical protein HPB51_018868 [Rhipicephalus microplus]|uniref:Uncharacterized protein n=1 Tax=Rhipicephalus microplus TaxID=6941 RepID=A0A9J6DP08_RHIMP|nr:hypothetical protein HPB51_018868 [Rhipicephalus microplus]
MDANHIGSGSGTFLRKISSCRPVAMIITTAKPIPDFNLERHPALQHMASVSASVTANEKQSLAFRSMDHMMDTQTSQDADTQASNEHNAQPWIPITKRANKRRLLQPHTIPTQQLPSTPSEPALRQSRPETRLLRLPPLPAKDCKLEIRPHGGINLSNVCPKTLLLAVAHAANIRSEKPDIKLHVDENQNVQIISTSSKHITTALGKIT